MITTSSVLQQFSVNSCYKVNFDPSDPYIEALTLSVTVSGFYELIKEKQGHKSETLI